MGGGGRRRPLELVEHVAAGLEVAPNFDKIEDVAHVEVGGLVGLLFVTEERGADGHGRHSRMHAAEAAVVAPVEVAGVRLAVTEAVDATTGALESVERCSVESYWQTSASLEHHLEGGRFNARAERAVGRHVEPRTSLRL